MVLSSTIKFSNSLGVTTAEKKIDKGQVTKGKVHDHVEFWIDLDDYDHA